ncbi:hypothetical protein GDO81_008006 [Engystomops pustulosus]|uniref:KxDL motif-containing protein 1 n=1 Tax=Engystomops pustulosus TaxID=76066 RepID=A0AAV7CC61_ENGPU|nr:hypothetical protein GDO81_008006 [Engystomops pustulosus]
MEASASGLFCSRILNMVNCEDVNAIILAQRHMLDCFVKTNKMLSNFNSLSNTRLQQMRDRFIHHTRTLVEMKKNLDIIFRRIRMLKGKLAKQYPEFSVVPKSAATTIATSEQSTESCDTSPSIISPTMSQDFENLSQALSETPSANCQLLTDDEV